MFVIITPIHMVIKYSNVTFVEKCLDLKVIIIDISNPVKRNMSLRIINVQVAVKEFNIPLTP